MRNIKLYLIIIVICSACKDPKHNIKADFTNKLSDLELIKHYVVNDSIDISGIISSEFFYTYPDEFRIALEKLQICRIIEVKLKKCKDVMYIFQFKNCEMNNGELYYYYRLSTSGCIMGTITDTYVISDNWNVILSEYDLIYD